MATTFISTIDTPKNATRNVSETAKGGRDSLKKN
jgi:hypothetical protein